MDELISVIVPVHNIRECLPRCLDSIIRQTYRNLEIILVDDGASDGSGSICDEYAGKDARIRVLHKQNQGVSNARNDGIKMAKGDFITFVDSDDWIAERTYEILHKAAIDYQADCVAGAFISVKVKNGVVKRRKSKRRQIFTETSQGAMKRTLLGSSSACNRLFRREVVEGVIFPPNRRNEDEVFALHVYEKCNKVVYLPDQTYFYRIRKDSETHSPFHIGKLDAFYNARDNLAFIREKHPQLVKAAECKYLKMMIYCYGRAKFARRDAKLNEAKKELKRELIKKENQKLAGENQYLPGIYKMLMMACRLPLV